MPMSNKKVFVDTNVLLSQSFKLEDYSKVYICITTIEELDGLKKSDSVGYLARQATKNIEKANNVEIKYDYTYSGCKYLEHKNDNIILGFAYETYTIDNECMFLTDDYNLLLKAKAMNLPCSLFEFKHDDEEKYTGYKEVILTEYEQAVHYECPVNRYGLLNGEYLLIKNENGEIIDRQCWIEGKGFRPINAKLFKSLYFGDIKAKDVYQQLAMDSLYNSQFTMLMGYAGTAKTLLSLGWIMQNIQTGKIGKCIIIFNPVKLKNNEQLGYYSGNRTEKLLQNSIGGILSSKLGDMNMVETLINQGKIMIIPTSDIRGIEISDNDCLFVSEAQNTDAYTMKTIIQRAKEGCKIIVEGDMEEQKDIRVSSKDNGMQRVIDVFKGSPYFSCVRLQKIYRSPIAELAQNI